MRSRDQMSGLRSPQPSNYAIHQTSGSLALTFNEIPLSSDSDAPRRQLSLILFWLGVMTTGPILWIVGVILLVTYIAQLTKSEPKQTKVPLCTYWLLFILTPLLVFGAMFEFSPPVFLIGLFVLVVLTVIGEHGFRLWIGLFGFSR